MIHYLTLEDRSMFSEYLAYWGRELAGSAIAIVSYEQLLETKILDPGVYVFTTFDEVEPAMRRFIDALTDQLRGSRGMRILNDPARVTLRFDLHSVLSRAGLNEFRSWRAGDDMRAVRYPVFIRTERAHDGAFSPLLSSAAEVETWIGRALALGKQLDDLMVVEFCDTADAGRTYRKYGAFNVDGRIIPRSLNYGREWMLKFGANEFSREMVEDELAYVSTNPHEEQLHEIFRIAAIDYGRIDYSMLNDRVQTWEINTNPTIGRGLLPSSREIDSALHGIREKTKEVFYSAFNEAWAALTAQSLREGAAPVPSRVDPIVMAAARAEVRRRWRTAAGIIRGGVRVVKPLLRTPIAPLLRMLYRLPERIVTTKAATLFRTLGRRRRNAVIR